ncbi:hypothetical protein [Methanolobus sp.]|uniref:DUF7289 family protein n=1 Tax=Methanolobus sp. TaxID=1874737 RepID=UPI0025F64E51|nr:hypothetical protein [Methanolobus sp.]
MGKDLSGNKFAVSSVIGIIVMLAITLLSIGIMLLYTMPAIDSMQDMAKAQKIEQAFTVFDSRTSKAALGESPLQTTGLSLMGGNVEVRGEEDAYNESRIMIIGLSADSTWYNEFYNNSGYWNAWADYKNKTDFAGFNASMGKIVYTYNDRIIAYEGGGVWSKYPTGGTIMISPPEFHFNGETLTLPIMQIKGNTSIAGTTDASISIASSNDPEILFPNTILNSIFVNPLDVDKIIIYIQSEFYDGWADYAETLISTTATLDYENKTAIIELDTEPEMGTISPLPNSFKIPALNHTNTTPFDNFSFYLFTSDDSSFFVASGMTLTATSGTKTLVYSFYKKDKANIILAAAPSMTSYGLEYTDSSVGISEIWESSSGSTFPVNGQKTPTKQAESTIDIISDTYLMYYDTSNSEYSWGPVGSTSSTPDITITDSNANRTQSLNNITHHYMKLLAQDGTIECTLEEKGNQKIEFEKSSYTILYDAEGPILTFLHVTRNELEATID